jgi:hypothetical protein
MTAVHGFMDASLERIDGWNDPSFSEVGVADNQSRR